MAPREVMVDRQPSTKYRLMPRSPILATRLLCSRIFAGLMSMCTTCNAWTNSHSLL